MRPRIALSAVVLPAPFGPMSPRIRPSSTRKSTPSRAMLVPKALWRPRASMHVMASVLLLEAFRGLASGSGIQEFLRFQAQPLNVGVDSRPLLGQKLLALAFQQQLARTRIDKHAATSLAFDQLLVDQLLI